MLSFFSRHNLSLTMAFSVLLTVLNILPSQGTSAESLTTSLELTSQTSETHFLVAQRGFRGFSSRYGAAPSRRRTPFRRGSCFPPETEMIALFPPEEIVADEQDPQNINRDRSWYTASAYPTFFIHLPQNSAQTAEIVVEDSDRNIVYSVLVNLSSLRDGESNLIPKGFIGIDLGEKAEELQIPPLNPGENYLWEIQLICNNIDRSGNPLVSGWITRIDQTEQTQINNLTAQLNTEEIPWVYTENGIWYSALNALAHNYLDRGQNQGWISLLRAVGYGALVNDPLIGMAQTEQVFIGRLPEIQF